MDHVVDRMRDEAFISARAKDERRAASDSAGARCTAGGTQSRTRRRPRHQHFRRCHFLGSRSRCPPSCASSVRRSSARKDANNRRERACTETWLRHVQVSGSTGDCEMHRSDGHLGRPSDCAVAVADARLATHPACDTLFEPMSQRIRVFATCDIGDALNILDHKGYDLEVYPKPEAPPKSLIVEKVKSGVDGLITTLRDPIDAEVFAAGKGTLKVVAQYAVGFDNINRARCQQVQNPIHEYRRRPDRSDRRVCLLPDGRARPQTLARRTSDPRKSLGLLASRTCHFWATKSPEKPSPSSAPDASASPSSRSARDST